MLCRGGTRPSVNPITPNSAVMKGKLYKRIELVLVVGSAGFLGTAVIISRERVHWI